jgi:predicted nucleotide-binding protein (sugar kinase/HSP70/actin superfamily)
MTDGAHIAAAQMSQDHRSVLDRTGQRYPQTHPRVVHVLPYHMSDFMSAMFARVYARRGMAFRSGGRLTPELLQEARKLCSGRECLAFTAIAGGTHRDITRHRARDEISIYWGLEQEGPCQCGAWPLVWQVFARRLGLENAIFPGHATLRNNFFGHGPLFGAELISAMAAAEVLDEAQNSLRCIAKDSASALAAFDEEARAVVESAGRGILGVIRALRRWSRNVAKIPRRCSVREVPKVLIFGGGVLGMIQQPIVEFLTERGIAAKVADSSEFILLVESEFIMRFGFVSGRHDPATQFSWPSLLSAALRETTSRDNASKARQALTSMTIVEAGGALVALYKAIARASGLNHDGHFRLQDVIEAGNRHIPFNTFCEAITPVGKFELTAAQGHYDGFVHVATFNCQPSLDAQGVIRKLANERNVGLAALDVERPGLTPSNVRLLENVVVQAKRRRAAIGAVS